MLGLHRMSTLDVQAQRQAADPSAGSRFTPVTIEIATCSITITSLRRRIPKTMIALITMLPAASATAHRRHQTVTSTTNEAMLMLLTTAADTVVMPTGGWVIILQLLRPRISRVDRQASTVNCRDTISSGWRIFACLVSGVEAEVVAVAGTSTHPSRSSSATHHHSSSARGRVRPGVAQVMMIWIGAVVRRRRHHQRVAVRTISGPTIVLLLTTVALMIRGGDQTRLSTATEVIDLVSSPLRR